MAENEKNQEKIKEVKQEEPKKEEQKKENETKTAEFKKVTPSKETAKTTNTPKQKATTTKVKTKEKESKRTMALRILAVIIILLAIISLIYVALPSPAKVLQQGLKDLQTGNFERAKEYLDFDELVNIPVLSFENNENKQEIQKLFFDQLEFSIKKVEKGEDIATIEVEIINKNFKTIMQNTTKELTQKFFNNEDADQKNILIEQLKNEAIDKVTTKETITVQKQDGKWKIVVDEKLRNAIFPGLTEAIDSIAS